MTSLTEALERCEQAEAAYQTLLYERPRVFDERRIGKVEDESIAARDALKAALSERCDGIPAERLIAALS